MSPFRVKVKLTVPEKSKPGETKSVVFESEILDVRYENNKAVFLIYSDETGFTLVGSEHCKLVKNNTKK